MSKWWNKPIDWKGKDFPLAITFLIILIIAGFQTYYDWEFGIIEYVIIGTLLMGLTALLPKGEKSD